MRPSGISAFVLGLSFFALTATCIWILHWSGGLPLFWPAPGILLAYMAARPRRYYRPALISCALGGWAAMILMGWPPVDSMLMMVLALVEEVVAFHMLSKLRKGRIDWFDTLEGLVTFVLVAGIGASAIFALPASFLSGAVSDQAQWVVWLSWFAADSLGAFIATPLAYLAFSGSIRRDFFARSAGENLSTILSVLTVGIVGLVVFFQEIGPFLFLPFFPLMIASFKAERVGVLLSVSVLTIIGCLAAWMGRGPIATAMGGGFWSLHGLQLYIATALLTALPASVELRRRRNANRRLTDALNRLSKSERNAQQAAITDDLTGLANRRGFLQALNEAISERKGLTLAIVDLDGFKAINDRWGHLIGDQLLKRVAERFREVAGDTGTLARLGGDEFAFLSTAQTAADPDSVGRALASSLNREISVCGHQFSVTSACGVVRSEPGASSSPSRLLARADVSMYHAKRSEDEQWLVFSSEMEADEQRKAVILEKLATTKGRKEVRLVYQPIVDLETGEICSVEALARWDCPGLGPVSPAQFIPLAERGRLIRPLTWHLLEVATREFRSLTPGVSLSFNVSARHISDERFAEGVLRTLERQRFSPAQLKLEVTETSVMGNSEVAAMNCKALQQEGVRIVLDDFGAGYASVSYLRTMRFDEIKLDSSLTLNARSQDGLTLVKGVLDLCNTLDVPCTAEHLGDNQDVDRFRQIGCRYGQGFALHRPMSAADLSALLTSTGVRGLRAA